MAQGRWPKRTVNWSLEGRKRKGRLEMKWLREVTRMMKQKILTT